MAHPGGSRCWIRALLVLVASLAATMALAGHTPRPVPQARMVFVMDSLCGLEQTQGANRRAKTLACVARGGRLQLYDWVRDAVYEIDFSSENQRLRLLNDFAGTEAAVQGLWDDRARRVQLRDVQPFQAPEKRHLLTDE
jgi:hypothetical protein